MHRKVAACFTFLTAFLHIIKTYEKYKTHSQKHVGVSLHITSLISYWGREIMSLVPHRQTQRPLAVHGWRWSAYSAPPPGPKWLFRIVVDSRPQSHSVLLGASRKQTLWLVSLGG